VKYLFGIIVVGVEEEVDRNRNKRQRRIYFGCARGQFLLMLPASLDTWFFSPFFSYLSDATQEQGDEPNPLFQSKPTLQKNRKER
jgi:hypothetical protein